MTQGADNDLLDIRFYLEQTPVLYNRDNEPLEDLNANSLTIDNKAISARDIALQAQVDLTAHIGQGGVLAHANGTTTDSGFLSASDKAKLDLIEDKANLNILAPVDAVDLIARNTTTLHRHRVATTTINGFLSASDKAKLDTIEAGAQVNNISVAEATQLTSGGNADTLHYHDYAPGVETFTQAIHDVTDHAGLPGIGSFSGLTSINYILGPAQVGRGVTVFSNLYVFSTLDIVDAEMTHFKDNGWWGNSERFLVNNVSIAGTTGTVIYEVSKNGTGGIDAEMRCWQGGYGLA